MVVERVLITQSCSEEGPCSASSLLLPEPSKGEEEEKSSKIAVS
jgi:hypothetical protein